MAEYQPKTGAKCSCRRGVQRDNCPNCEGTGMVIDFRAIRARAIARQDAPHPVPAPHNLPPRSWGNPPRFGLASVAAVIRPGYDR